MKALSILGIIFSSVMLLGCLTVIGEEGVWIVFLVFAYFLAQSIAILRNIG